ncbi:MAG TPA: SBBP repeat-containing protein [Hanamia sp.]
MPYLSLNSFAQLNNSVIPPSTIWAKVAGGAATSIEKTLGISADQNGNTYITGSFGGTISFPAEPNPIQLTSEGGDDIFIAKYDASGNVLWAKRAGGTGADNGNAIKFDGYGNIYVVGSYTESADFGSLNLTNPITSSVNVFIAKCNGATGDFLWVKQGLGSDYYYRAALDVAVDNTGDAYLTGQFENKTTFAPLPTLTSAGWWDIFVVKYNSAGIPQWETTAGSSEAGYNLESGNGIAVDNSGNVFITGNFNGSSANPTYFGNIPLVSSGGGGFYEEDYFLAKYNTSTSSWEWAVEGGGAGTDYGMKVSLDSYGNPYVNGFLNSSTATFGSISISESGPKGYFVAKYSPNGNLSWVNPTGGTGYNGVSCSKVDDIGNFYFAGTFDGTTTVGDTTITSNGYDNSYIASWNSNGVFQWVKHIPGSYYATLSAMDVEGNGNIDITGTFAGTETFDCTVLNSLSYSNLAIAKLGISNLGPDVPTITASANNICSGINTTLSISSGNLNNATAWKWYTGSCGGTLVGSGTSITVSPTQNTTYYARGEGGCAGPGACDSITIAINKTPPFITCTGDKFVNPNTSGCNYTQTGTSWDATATDNCSISSITYTLSGATTNTTGNLQTLNNVTFLLGVTTVTAVATDVNGNSSTCTFNVTVTSALSTSFTNSNNHIYFGVDGYNTSTITNKPTGGTGPYVVWVSSTRNLLCNQVDNSGNETWTGGAGTINSWNTICGSINGLSISTADGISEGSSYSVTVSLMADADITDSITDAFGCIIKDTLHIIAEDARCFKGNTKVMMCHYTGSTTNPTTQICVDQSAVDAHLAQGDKLGTCNNTLSASRMIAPVITETPKKLEVTVSPNPASTYFNLGIKSASKEIVKITVVDVRGRKVEQRNNVPANSSLQLGNSYRSGIYFAEVVQGNDKIILKLIKQPE